MSIKITALIGLAGLFCALLSFYLFQLPPTGGSAFNQELEILPGMSFNEITNKLKETHLIRSKTAFKIYSLMSGRAHQLKPGTYILSSEFSIPRLVEILTDGPAEISITVIPGMTLRKIDERLSSLKIIKLGDLVNFDINELKRDYPWLIRAQSLEGFLLPDTYRFFLGSDRNLVARRFLDNFRFKALPFFKESDSLLETLILASLLEKEIPNHDEQRIAAGILLKRLEVGMPLQVDASLVYAKCLGQFLNCPLLVEGDYKIDSAYNTYLHTGLPKGPICNPGLESIKSTLNFQKSEYWYYLSDPETKKTIFSKDLDEHNKNRAKYLLK